MPEGAVTRGNPEELADVRAHRSIERSLQDDGRRAQRQSAREGSVGSPIPCVTMASAASWRTYEASSLPRVLAAALEAFAEEGYEGTSIRDIGARAGLSVPGLYHHHRSKQEILRR